MISYPFISELFTNVLLKSKAIEGRFYMCPKWGSEINSDELGQVIKDLVIPPGTVKRYPLALMMPPASNAKYVDKNGEWESYRAKMFFLTTTYYTGTNQPKSPNPNTKTSTHTIIQDWHDMKRPAQNFIRVLDMVQRSNSLIRDKFRLDQHRDRMISPVTMVGDDRASGVMLDFLFSVFIGCEIEDYDEADISSIEIPEADSHPEHQL